MNEILNFKIKFISNYSGATALVRAVASKCLRNAQILIDNKAEVGARTNEGMNALHIAACLGDITAFEQLLSATGGEINAQNKFGNTPLMEAALVANQTDSQFLRFLKCAVDKEANLEKTNNYEKSLLHLLAIKELPKSLEIVKQSKINLNQKDGNGHTALVDALLSGSFHSTKILLSPNNSSNSQSARFEKMEKTVGTVFHAAKHADKRIEELQVAELGRFAIDLKDFYFLQLRVNSCGINPCGEIEKKVQFCAKTIIFLEA